jgi:hypothetical protein
MCVVAIEEREFSFKDIFLAHNQLPKPTNNSKILGSIATARRRPASGSPSHGDVVGIVTRFGKCLAHQQHNNSIALSTAVVSIHHHHPSMLTNDKQTASR